MSGSGDLIDRYRRAPPTCIYCEDGRLTREHVVGQAIGGRLHARILCQAHNNAIGAATDGPYAERFAPIVAFLEVPRQDGQVGTSFRARFDDETPARVEIDGRIPLRSLESSDLDSQGKFRAAKGDLALMDHLKAVGKLAESAGPVIATVEMPPPIRFEIAADQLAEAVALKAAVHFVAGFVADIPTSLASTLLPCIQGFEKGAAPTFIRSVLLDEAMFPRGWPPSHEVTCFAVQEALYVSVMHFGLHSYLVRLPMSAPLTRGRRYRQILGKSEPEMYDDVEPISIPWDRELSDVDLADFQEYAEAWNDRVMRAAGRRDTRAKIRRAVERLQSRTEWARLSYDDRLTAELQIEGFPTEQIQQLLPIVRRKREEGVPPWSLDDDQIVVQRLPDEPSTGDGTTT